MQQKWTETEQDRGVEETVLKQSSVNGPPHPKHVLKWFKRQCSRQSTRDPCALRLLDLYTGEHEAGTPCTGWMKGNFNDCCALFPNPTSCIRERSHLGAAKSATSLTEQLSILVTCYCLALYKNSCTNLIGQAVFPGDLVFMQHAGLYAALACLGTIFCWLSKNLIKCLALLCLECFLWD